ncbi:MAG: SRPBCC family protein [Beijerinckiaceae bacterium]
MRKPDRFLIARKIRINAPREKVFPLINTIQRWTEWSPWQTKDPAIQQTLGPITEGIGAYQEWKGNNKVGEGRMEIVESAALSRIVYRLDFLRPMKAQNRAVFTLTDTGGATEVTWEMDGPSPLLSKIMDTLMNMDKMIGRDFENGLANLKKLSEG